MEETSAVPEVGDEDDGDGKKRLKDGVGGVRLPRRFTPRNDDVDPEGVEKKDGEIGSK